MEKREAGEGGEGQGFYSVESNSKRKNFALRIREITKGDKKGNWEKKKGGWIGRIRLDVRGGTAEGIAGILTA